MKILVQRFSTLRRHHHPVETLNLRVSRRFSRAQEKCGRERIGLKGFDWPTRFEAKLQHELLARLGKVVTSKEDINAVPVAVVVNAEVEILATEPVSSKRCKAR